MNQHHQPPVPPSNPFEGDLLERQPTVESYTALLRQAGGPCVFALNGGLGAGKTTFIGFWEKYLGNEGFKTSTFSVWKQDLTPQDLAGKIDEISHGHTEGRPLVVFIDELDQRLPSSIDEFFRHLEPIFRKENRVFVLPINKHEIERSLKLARGEEFDVTGYLGRFLDCELKLPKEESARKEFVRKKCERLGVPVSRDAVSQSEKDYAREMLADFLGISDLEIRDIVQILSHLRSICQLASAGPLDYALFTSCFLMLCVFDPELYDKFTRQEISDADVFDKFDRPHVGRVRQVYRTEFWAALTAVFICWKSPGSISDGCEQSHLWRRCQEKQFFADRVRAIMNAYRGHIEVEDVIQRIGSLAGKFRTG